MEQEEPTTFGISIAIGVAVLIAIVFVLALVCSLLGLVSGAVELGNSSGVFWLADAVLLA